MLIWLILLPLLLWSLWTAFNGILNCIRPWKPRTIVTRCEMHAVRANPDAVVQVEVIDA